MEWDVKQRRERQAAMGRADDELPRGGNPLATVAVLVLMLAVAAFVILMIMGHGGGA